MVYHIPSMILRPIKSSSISESAYVSIEEAIVRNELAPGTLLSDRQLSETLEISRTPVREALQSLEASGLVIRRGRVGWKVAGFDQQDARELFELRRIFEPQGLERLIESWEEASVVELSGFFADFPDRLPQELYGSYLERDHEFHKRIVAWSGNRRIIQFYGVVEKQINRIRHYLAPGYEGRIHNVVVEHRRLCEAISEKDPEAAHQALLDHLWAGEKAMTEFLAQKEPEGSELVGDGLARLRGECKV